MEKLDQILKHFDIKPQKYHYEPLTNGMINDTYLVSNADRPLFILQKINTAVFTEVDSLIHNIDLVLPNLASSDYEKVVLEKTKSGTSFYKDDNGNIWRLMTYVNNSRVYNTTTDPEVAFEAGRIIGLFHKLLANSDPSLLQETLVDFHNIAFRYSQFLEATKNSKPENIEKAKEPIAFVEKHISMLLELQMVKLPLRVCHNDTKLNNILFSKDNKSLCLIDLDTIMPGYFLYDFGDAVRTIVNRAPEDEVNLNLINFDQKIFGSFIKGIAANGKILTKTEIDHLSLGAILLPFLHGIRALTDFLENNRYYKVKYENQNLDRCNSLFEFSKLALENKDFMDASIKKYLV
jgi:Ser/Thr protein kinase RdoA (MazF antagonist)